ncbi:ribosyldihydronicotinamide dehydrogenase [quinone]-like [Xenentodon cancila]
MARKMLIVYAHQSPASFSAAAKNAAVEVLTAQGCTVEVSDLYAMTFKATATAEDIKGDVKNAEHFSYLEETRLAWEEGMYKYELFWTPCRNGILHHCGFQVVAPQIFWAPSCATALHSHSSVLHCYYSKY